jgi:hypothetical protein
MTFDHAKDLCMGFFKEAYEARAFTFPEHARVLELGCAEANWQKQIREARPDLHLTGIDQRGVKRPECDRLLREDILSTRAFQKAEFDAIVAVSVIEWAGIGHYGDPKCESGDSRMMRRAHQWLKPDGFMYFDVPFNEAGHIIRGHLRAYSDESIRQRLLQDRWKIRWSQHFEGRLTPEAAPHPDGPYIALVVTPIHE